MGQLKNFVTKLTPKQLVDFMIKSIEEPVVTLDFSTFGYAEELVNMPGKRIMCFGCAATNFALKAANKDYNSTINYIGTLTVTDFGEGVRFKLIQESYDYLNNFECAINYLRLGNIITYNRYAKLIGLPFLPLTTLPLLDNDSWRGMIGAYKKYAESLVTTKYYRYKSDKHSKLFELIVGSKTWYNQYDEKIEPSHILAKKSARTIVLKPDGSYFIQGAAGYFYYTEKPTL